MKRIIQYLCGVILAGIICQITPAFGQPTNDKLLTFQKFVNGEIPVKEAIVYRTLSDTNGKVINQEWFRFGYQDDGATWYSQRLQPDTNDPTLLVPKYANYGASYSNLWVISDKDIQIVPKTFATNSLLYTKVGERNMMFSALSLGLPRILNVQKIANARIEWDGLKFRTAVDDKRDKNRDKLTVVFLNGQLKLGANGLPVSAKFRGTDTLPDGLVRYEYQFKDIGIPSIFIVKYPGGEEFQYKFLSLMLGSNDVSKTDGYVPSLFADLKIERHITVWTNDKPYSLIDGKFIPAFGVRQQHIKPIGIAVLIISVIASAIFLALWYRHSKYKQK